MIDNRRLKDLIRMMVDNDLTEIDISDEKESIVLRRDKEPVAYYPPMPFAGAPMPQPPVGQASPGGGDPAAGAAGGGEKAADDETGLVAVTSPMVGTFYAQPKPDAPPFVSVGSEVKPDTVVCLVEAMKVFNEIQAEVEGVIEKVLVSNADPVEFGQKLFLVRPR
ncbi:MAG TPA: acetyl-CoA carboxylase biotin carboxyl carrier protein [Phycisphaeraceae bacterium]|nr:acetyl-CoA carboxylase biotin carboxyl carrier protein [Phycisphaeraceae bacterium]